PNNYTARTVHQGRHLGHLGVSEPLFVDLVLPSEKSRKAQLIRGSIPVVLLLEEKAEVVTDNVLTSAGKKKRLSNADIMIRDVETQENRRYGIRVIVKEDQQAIGWGSYNERLELQDDKGNRYETNGGGYSSDGEGGVQLGTYFIPPDEGKVGPP